MDPSIKKCRLCSGELKYAAEREKEDEGRCQGNRERIEFRKE